MQCSLYTKVLRQALNSTWLYTDEFWSIYLFQIHFISMLNAKNLPIYSQLLAEKMWVMILQLHDFALFLHSRIRNEWTCQEFAVKRCLWGKISLCNKSPYLELFWSAFSRIWTDILRISPYSVRMRENADQNSSKYGQFSRSVCCLFSLGVFHLPKIKMPYPSYFMIVDVWIDYFRSICYVMTKVKTLISSMHAQLRKVQEFDKEFVCFSDEVMIQKIKFKDYVAAQNGPKYTSHLTHFCYST